MHCDLKFTVPIKRNFVPIKRTNLLLVSWFGFCSLRFVPIKRLSQLYGVPIKRNRLYLTRYVVLQVSFNYENSKSLELSYCEYGVKNIISSSFQRSKVYKNVLKTIYFQVFELN
ncbi:hypothetical protein RF11_15281 [Thelohanellus kitauei]|uniref:Uncharacterized protein n=1 Tax=Thelohanellus kitauei TaxID=669202 RepID=A0A0C2NJX8_THEKT|nr:hypothetical protein RF11_15281 [Thelohanellus kitauei]